MSARQLIFLSPYRLPTQSTLSLADDEVAAFLNAYAALWHPAVLHLCLPPPRSESPPEPEAPSVSDTEAGDEFGPDEYPSSDGDEPADDSFDRREPETSQASWVPPHVASPYDHEQPQPGAIYVVAGGAPLILPDDWEQRVRDAGAVVFRATADREQTLCNLRATLETLEDERTRRLLSLDRADVAPFFGLGFGLLQLEALFEAMSHENVLALQEFGEDLAAAVAVLDEADASPGLPHLQAAAERLLSAREVVYAVSIHVLDLSLLDSACLGAPWPLADTRGLPWNLLACSSLLARLAHEQPERFAALRERVASERVEVQGGLDVERQDALLPLESQLWNLLRGQAVYQEMLGQDVRVFARRRFGFHPQLPLYLQHVGIGHCLLLTFDESVLPAHRAPVVSWPSPDGKQVEAFTRIPHPVDTPQTGFHLAHYLHETIMQDQAATLALLHRPRVLGERGSGKPAAWYEDWLELSRLAPVLGRWTTFTGYFSEVLTGDYTPSASPDEFQCDYLSFGGGTGEQSSAVRAEGAEDGTEPPAGGGAALAPDPWPSTPTPISGFARQVRARRRVDTAWTLAALLRGLKGHVGDIEGLPFEDYLSGLEDRFESGEVPLDKVEHELNEVQARAAAALSQRLIARGQENHPGYLVLNPCSFTRRVVVELPGVTNLLPVEGPLKACQVEEGAARAVVEVPGLGFAWVPRSGAPAGTPPASRMRLADVAKTAGSHAPLCVRNEFLEAEVDPVTGGLKSIRDQRTRVPRLGQQLVFNPGSTMRAKQIHTTSTGPALGEIVSEGELLDGQGRVLAMFRQRFRAWLGRPLLDLRIELVPGPAFLANAATGYPWHTYYAARFAWRDETATLLRGSGGMASVTSHTRPETPEFLELRLGRQNTVLFPGGLPFHQRHGGRMLDVLLVVPGETAQVFDLGIGLDREHPMQTALGLVSPAPLVSTDRGPPHIGATGWLFHLDAPNLLLTSLRPAPEGADGVVARLLECGGHGGAAELRCVRDPRSAVVQDGRATAILDATTEGDAAQIEVAPNDLVQLRIDFG
jgi:hypothetical protein